MMQSKWNPDKVIKKQIIYVIVTAVKEISKHRQESTISGEFQYNNIANDDLGLFK